MIGGRCAVALECGVWRLADDVVLARDQFVTLVIKRSWPLTSWLRLSLHLEVRAVADGWPLPTA
jgi:hypothetical protein